MKARKPQKVLAAVAMGTIALTASLGLTGTAQAAETSEDAFPQAVSPFTVLSIDRGSPDNPVPAHHYGPYRSLHDCQYALADQSGGGRNVARGCMKENNGRYYYWGWGAGERH